MSNKAITLPEWKSSYVLVVLCLILFGALGIGNASAADANLLDTM